MASPNTFRIERSTVIAAPAEALFPFVDDFHQWTLWSPWEKLDADLHRTYSGAERGVGAVYQWEGKKSGAGRMEMVGSTPASKITIDLQFLKPMRQRNTAEFTFEPADGGTRVSWVMQGPANLFTKVMGLFMSMDKMIGKDFEAGLANLKAIGEAKQAA